jgi:hypothetical protein
MSSVNTVSNSNISSTSAGLLRAGIFNSAVGQQSKWGGGAKHGEVASRGQLGKKAVDKIVEEKTAQAEAANKPDSQAFRNFYGGNRNLPKADYFQSYREQTLRARLQNDFDDFANLKEKAGFLSSWTAGLSA